MMPNVNPLPKIVLPGGAEETSRLGFGCAYIQTETKQLIRCAYDNGIRHFDVARSYARGASEHILADALRGANDVTICTKYGFVPPKIAPGAYFAVRQIGKPLLKLLRRSPGVGAKVSRGMGGLIGRASFTAAELNLSVKLSLKQLQRPRIDILLMHEAAFTDLQDPELLKSLKDLRAAGTIGVFGVGGESHRVPDLIKWAPSFCDVLQHEWTGNLVPDDGAFHIIYRVPTFVDRLLGTNDNERKHLLEKWSSQVDLDLGNGMLAALSLRACLEKNSSSMVIFSSSSLERISLNCKVAAEDEYRIPAMRLANLLAELNRNDRGPW